MSDVRKKNSLTVVSQESGGRFGALLDMLSELKYRVDIAPPAAINQAAGDPCMIYLGAQDWAPDVLNQLDAGWRSPLLALEKRAFGWAEKVVRRCPDFLIWPCGRSELKLRLERNCVPTEGAAPHKNVLKRSAPVSALGFVGRSAVFLNSLLMLKRYAQCDAAVLIHGETGTGKELAARAIHRFHNRREAAFVPVSCGALPDSLIEAELFGHASGAFTDAKQAKDGLVAQAQGGTLFLDEVEALSAKGQAALLRFLESLEYRRVGGSRTRKANVRIIAAGNEDFHALARRGAFRQDLLYRLNVLSLGLPPLRSRDGDAELLADYFVNVFSQKYETGPLAISPASRRWLSEYHWPGNVRELENLVHRAVVTANGNVIELMSEFESNGAPAQLELRFGDAKRHAITQFERSYLVDLMQATGGNVTKAAQKAGKERRCLGKLLKKHGIEADAFHVGKTD